MIKKTMKKPPDIETILQTIVVLFVIAVPVIGIGVFAVSILYILGI